MKRLCTVSIFQSFSSSPIIPYDDPRLRIPKQQDYSPNSATVTQLLHSAIESELHATSKALAMLRSDIQRWRLRLHFPLVPLEFFDSVHQRFVNIVVRRVQWFQFFANSSAARADHITNSLLLLGCFIWLFSFLATNCSSSKWRSWGNRGGLWLLA